MLGLPPETLPETGGVLSRTPDWEANPTYVAATGIFVLLAVGTLLASLAVRRIGR
jgi:hypothetical protein